MGANVNFSAMKGKELAEKVAEKTGVSRATAKDQVEEVVHRILTSLKQGKPVRLPGVGKLIRKDSR
jgi:nucleoid DNA-binding protein